MEKVLIFGVFFYTVEVFLKIAVGVWKAVSEKLLVIVVLESVSESECVVSSEESTLIPLISIRMIVDRLSNPMPPDTLFIFHFIAEFKNFHSVIIKGIRLSKIQKIEFYFLSFEGIAASKEVPLGVAICVDVVLKD